jgi:hypothetical protein
MGFRNANAVRYGVTSLPRAILVDQNGVVVDTVARGQRLFQHLHELLGPPDGSLGDGIGQNEEPSGDAGVVPTSFEDSVQIGPDGGATPAPTVPEDPAEAGEVSAPSVIEE